MCDSRVPVWALAGRVLLNTLFVAACTRIKGGGRALTCTKRPSRERYHTLSASGGGSPNPPTSSSSAPACSSESLLLVLSTRRFARACAFEAAPAVPGRGDHMSLEQPGERSLPHREVTRGQHRLLVDM